MPVTFHTDGISYRQKEIRKHRNWMKRVIRDHGKHPGDIQVIFTSNAALLEINREYLNHNHFTDVITFDYSEGSSISGDVFISVDQVRIHAKEYGVRTEEELRRVMIHGVLHLLGFEDKSEEEGREMREKENEALFLWSKVGGYDS